jgi:hypothetical protein
MSVWKRRTWLMASSGPPPENTTAPLSPRKPYRRLSPSAPIAQTIGFALPSVVVTIGEPRPTYGDQGERAKQLREYLGPGDLIVFYAGLADIRAASGLVYALIGLLVVDDFRLAADVPPPGRDVNAHSRRVLAPGAQDIVVAGLPGVSGRLRHCLPIGEYRDRAYRVRRDLWEEWGGLSVKDGYLQRSARLPRFLDAKRFRRWLDAQKPIAHSSKQLEPATGATLFLQIDDGQRRGTVCPRRRALAGDLQADDP